MRTTLNIDDEALQAAMKLAGGRTKTEVINEALRRFVRAKRRLQLLDVRGKVEWEGEVDDLRKRT
jgi:Arc/MetJ family transcription regulator